MHWVFVEAALSGSHPLTPAQVRFVIPIQKTPSALIQWRCRWRCLASLEVESLGILQNQTISLPYVRENAWIQSAG